MQNSPPRDGAFICKMQITLTPAATGPITVKINFTLYQAQIRFPNERVYLQVQMLLAHHFSSFIDPGAAGGHLCCLGAHWPLQMVPSHRMKSINGDHLRVSAVSSTRDSCTGLR